MLASGDRFAPVDFNFQALWTQQTDSTWVLPRVSFGTLRRNLLVVFDVVCDFGPSLDG